MAKEDLSIIGMWKLISFAIQDNDGTLNYPFGKNVAGFAIIDAGGYFSAQLMDMKRPSFKSGDPRGGTPSEPKTTFENYVGYYGTFDLDDPKGVIIFHVRGAWPPNWIGSDQIRYCTSNGNRMIISTAPVLFSGQKVIGKLIWEHVN